MTSGAGLRNRPRRNVPRAFTLLEMILAISMVSLLAGAMVLALGGFRRGGGLAEGAERFETVLRMARAEAAGRGRRLKLNVDDQTGLIKILWEPQPLAQPGQFFEYSDSVWLNNVPNDLVRVVSCTLTGPSAYKTLNFEEFSDDREQAPEAITFYPDGSSDSAVIELAEADDSDVRRAVVELDGVNGIITTRILTSDELREDNEQIEGDYETGGEDG